MKKSIIGAAVAAVAMMAATAHADVVLPSTGNGELTLFVKNTTTGEVYARGLAISMDDILTEATAGGAYTGPTNTGYALPTIGPDANLTAFLATGTTAEFKWGVLVGDTVGSNTAGTRRFGLGTVVDLANTVSLPSNTQMVALGTSFNSFFSTLNNNLPDFSGSSIVGAGSTGGLWDTPGVGDLADTFFNQAPNSAFGALGGVLNFFALTSAGGSNATPARVFEFSDITLAANGTLSAPVPVPAAAWLLGSGLLGLLGIGRRNGKTAAVAA
jgi:hypothetical protein